MVRTLLLPRLVARHRRVPAHSTPSGDPVAQLRRRCGRLARDGHYRKAAIAQRQIVARVGNAAAWVSLGHFLSRAGRVDEAIDALKQGLFLHRRAGDAGRARTVARLLYQLRPCAPT